MLITDQHFKTTVYVHFYFVSPNKNLIIAYDLTNTKQFFCHPLGMVLKLIFITFTFKINFILLQSTELSTNQYLDCLPLS